MSGPLSDKTLSEGAHLVAALCIKYRLGRPAWGSNVRMHQEFFPTACPGPLAGAQHGAYIAAAQKYYDQMTGAAPASVDTPIEEDDFMAMFPNPDALRNSLIGVRPANTTESLSASINRIVAMDAKLDALTQAFTQVASANGVSDDDIAQIVAAVNKIGEDVRSEVKAGVSGALDGATVTINAQGGGQ